jgi:flagellar basal body rod protein FlgB
LTTNFIGRTTPAGQLKASLDASALRTRAIADRVARASAGQPTAFSLPAEGGNAARPDEGAIDIESEMVSLADEQLRYEAAAKLLEKTYAGLRASLQER